VIIRVEGHLSPYLDVTCGITWCGQITDGIALAHSKGPDTPYEGGWVISFEDLERIFLAAKAEREVQ
jgi:hypothetical protein